MNKFYSLAFVLTTTSILVRCAPCPKPDGADGGGTGGTAGSGGSPPIVCASLCAECVETQGQGRVARVCNGEPNGITIHFEEGEVHRVCDGYALNDCHTGTLCVAVSDGGMLSGTCQ